LLAAQLDIEFPVTFEITNPALPDLNTHVGVLEFIAEEGTVNLPQWVSPNPILEASSAN
jgi:ubiquitin fusion degradation protein 1